MLLNKPTSVFLPVCLSSMIWSQITMASGTGLGLFAIFRLRLRQFLVQEPSVSLNQFPVHPDLAALAQIADDVPVQAGDVLAAGLGIRFSESHVDRPADLFIEERVAAVLLNVVVRRNRELA